MTTQPARRWTPVTGREWSVYEYIVHYKESNDGIAPTMMEMRTALRYNYVMLRTILNKLQECNMITIGRTGTARNIKVTGGRWIGPLKTAKELA